MAKQGGARPVRTNTTAKPVSGPGKLSQRTDMMTASNPNVYGDRAAMENLMAGADWTKTQPQTAAPIAAAPQGAPAPQGPISSLFDPSSRPGEPVTSGLPVGPGRTPDVYVGNYDMINKYMPALELMASQEDAPESFKSLVNYVKVSGQQA